MNAADVAYWLAATLLLALLAETARHSEWMSDTWIHAATVSEVARHPLHPVEPLTGEHVPFPYFSPWAMVLGWCMRLSGASVFTVLTAAGLLSTGALLAAWKRLVNVMSPARSAPLVCLACLLLLWGTGTWFWSGFPSIGTLSIGFTWPSVLATAMWLELWRTALLVGELPRAHGMLVFAVLPGVLLLMHPFTASLAAVAVGATLAGQWRTSRQRVLDVSACAIASGLLALLWPWISLRILIANPSGFTAIHHLLYESFTKSWILLVLTVPALAARLIANRKDPFAWTAAICAVGVLVGGLTRQWSLGRLGPGIALPGQLALGCAMADAWTKRSQLRTPTWIAYSIAGAATTLALVVGAWANAWAVARALPGTSRRAAAEVATSAPSPYPRVRWIRPYVHTGDVAVANDWQVRRQLPAYGLRTVLPPWASPGLPDQQQRATAELALYHHSTSEKRRQQILRTYRVHWVVWSATATAPRWPFGGMRLVACGPDGAALLAVDDSLTRRPPRCPASRV